MPSLHNPPCLDIHMRGFGDSALCRHCARRGVGRGSGLRNKCVDKEEKGQVCAFPNNHNYGCILGIDDFDFGCIDVTLEKYEEIDFLLLFLVIIGIASIVYFSIVSVHEYGHYLILRREGVDISEFVLLGWKDGVTASNLIGGTAWVVPKGEFNKTPHVEWDCRFWCNRTKVEEYYGVS